MEMNNIKLMEKVQKLAKDIENKKYQEDLKKAAPLIKKINEMKEEILKDESSKQKAKSIIKNGIDFYFNLNDYNNQDIHNSIFDLEKFLNNDIDESILSCYSVDYIEEILNAFISLKTLIFKIYPAKEEIQRFFAILNFCSNNNLIDRETINSYLLTLNENLHFNAKYVRCYFGNSFSKNIYIEEPRNINESFSHYDYNEFTKYIVISEENLQVIKKIEKQLEEKINKINSYYLGE